MKTLFEDDDINVMAMAVFEKLKPFIEKSAENEDEVFDKKEVARYLKVSVSTIDKMVSKKQIPFFKVGEGKSGGVRFAKKKLAAWRRRKTVG